MRSKGNPNAHETVPFPSLRKVRIDPVCEFRETSYGIVKRVEVVSKWIDDFKTCEERQTVSILDYGCGTGDHITFPLAQSGHDVLGVDVHGQSILEARRRYTLPKLTFRVGELKDLMDEGLSFDLIVCSEVLEHLHNPEEFLRGLRSLLRPGGGLIITTPNGYGSFEMLRSVERALTRMGIHQRLRWIFHKVLKLSRRLEHNKSLSIEPDPGFLNRDSVHVQFFRLRSLEKLFSKSGFRIVGRRARTFLCGPYVDALFRLSPGQQALFRLNNRLADLLPLSWAADWMYFLKPEEAGSP